MKKNEILKIILPIISVSLILIIWELASYYHVINKALFSSPSLIFKEIFHNETIIYHLINSVIRLLISVFIGFFLGFMAGVLISQGQKFDFLDDIINFFMSIPGIAWAPVFILFLGFGNITIISVGILTAFFPVTYNILHGYKEIKQNLLDLGDVLSYTPFQKFWFINIPSIFNYLLLALKLAFARTWRTIIAVEMIAATMFGLGYMIFDARELINSKMMFAGIIISGFVYYIIENVFIRVLEELTVIKWGMKKRT